MQKRRRRVDFTNSWMFGRVMTDESICRDVIRAVLGIEAVRVEYLNAEQVLDPSPEVPELRLGERPGMGGRAGRRSARSVKICPDGQGPGIALAQDRGGGRAVQRGSRVGGQGVVGEHDRGERRAARAHKRPHCLRGGARGRSPRRSPRRSRGGFRAIRRPGIPAHRGRPCRRPCASGVRSRSSRRALPGTGSLKLLIL